MYVSRGLLFSEAEDWEGPAFQTCMNAAIVSNAFETSRRREVLSYSHHVEVAPLSADWQDKLLDEAEMWEISENLHRAELTVVQRSEQVSRWVELSDKVLAQLEPKPQGGRPEGGVNKAARELNLDRNEVQRSEQVSRWVELAAKAAQLAQPSGGNQPKESGIRKAAKVRDVAYFFHTAITVKPRVAAKFCRSPITVKPPDVGRFLVTLTMLRCIAPRLTLLPSAPVRRCGWRKSMTKLRRTVNYQSTARSGQMLEAATSHPTSAYAAMKSTKPASYAMPSAVITCLGGRPRATGGWPGSGLVCLPASLPTYRLQPEDRQKDG